MPDAWQSAAALLAAFCNNGSQGSRFSLPRLAVGFSGGLDSTVLLHWLACQRDTCRFVLSAMHVHHGLSPNADQWAEHCQQICSDLQIPLQIRHIDLTDKQGLGTEAAARRARYQCFEAADCDAVALAHHLNDQAETLLINLLRGSGPAGLAAMPASRQLTDGITLLRPFLALGRDQLLAYAEQHGLRWIEDESNTSPIYQRNRIRHELIPAITGIQPKILATLSRVAIHQSDASEILDECAVHDLAECETEGQLKIAALTRFSPPRQRNLLHYWLRQNGIHLEKRAFDELLRLAFDAADDTQPALVWRNAAVRRYRGALSITQASIAGGHELALSWQAGQSARLADWHGTLHWQQVEAGGIAEQYLQDGYQIRNRAGGEKFKLAANRPTRTLKSHCQQEGIAPWLRSSTPLIYQGKQLLAMPGLGVNIVFQSQHGEAGWLPIWQADHPNKDVLP